MTMLDKVEVLAENVQVADIEGRSLWDDARQRFLKNKAAVFSSIVLLLMVLLILLQLKKLHGLLFLILLHLFFTGKLFYLFYLLQLHLQLNI